MLRNGVGGTTPTRTLSAGVVVVRGSDRVPRYLLLRTYGYWDFPKGVVESGESPLSAAVREVAEETGLTDLSFRWGRDFRETPVYGKGKVARYYVAESCTGEVRLGVNPEIGRPEHHEFCWLDYPSARSRLVDRTRRVLDWARSTVAPKMQRG